MKNIKLNNEISQIRNRRKYLIFALLFVICVTLQTVGLPPQTAIAEVTPPMPRNTDPHWAYPTADPTTPFVGSVAGSSEAPGTAANPYAIDCEQRLADLAYFVNDKGEGYSGSFFKLTRDLDFGVFGEKLWTPIGTNQIYPFYGTFDGDGFSIKRISINETLASQNTGLFGNVGGIIRNLNVVNSNVKVAIDSGNPVAGGIVGSLNKGQIINCSFDGTVTIDCNYPASSGYSGGICAYNEQGQIVNCINYGTVTSNTTADAADGNSRAIGGICGQNSGRIINCVNVGAVKNNYTVSLTKKPIIYMGGVCGAMGNSADAVVNCYYQSKLLSNNAINSDGSLNNVQIFPDIPTNSAYPVKSSSSFTGDTLTTAVGMRDDNRNKYTDLIGALNMGAKYYNVDDRALQIWEKTDKIAITTTLAKILPDYKIQKGSEIIVIDGVTWHSSLTIDLLSNELLSDKYVGVSESQFGTYEKSLTIYSSSTTNPKTIYFEDRNGAKNPLKLTDNIDGTAPTIRATPYTSGNGINGYAVKIVDNETGVDWNTCEVLFTNIDLKIEEYIGYFVSLDGKQIFFAKGDGDYRIRISDRYGNMQETTLKLPLPPPIN